MSFEITTAFVQQFTGAVRHLGQQQYARFRGAVLEDQVTGESAYMEQMGATAAARVTARHTDSPIMNSQHLRRRIAPYGYRWGDLIDREDRVRMLIDPASNYAKAAAMAMERAYDDELIAAAFGTAYTGHTGSTALTWPNGDSENAPTTPAGMQVAVNDWTYGNGSGNAGMTVSKLVSAQVALLAGEGDDDEEMYVAYGAVQRGNLLATTEFTASEYNETREMLRKKIQGTSFLGFTSIQSQRLAKNSSGQTRCIAWRKSGLGIGVARPVETRIAERPDKNFSTYVYADESLGGARLEEVKVVEIICACVPEPNPTFAWDYAPLGGLKRIDEWGNYHSPNVAFADVVAVAWSDIMAKLQGNQGGGVEALPDVTLMEARVRQQVSTITLATQDYDVQTGGYAIWVARLPLGAAIRSIDVITNTSLGSSTIAFGDAHSGNGAIYGAATTLTATDTLTRMGPPTAMTGVEITQGYDYLGTNTNRGMPQTPSPSGGAGFEDILMFLGAADFPASGTMRVLTTYTID